MRIVDDRQVQDLDLDCHVEKHDTKITHGAQMSSSNLLQQLSADHCVLLATTYASESNIDAVRTLFSTRADAFDPEVALRILLTYLPETVDPALYTRLIALVVTGSQQQQQQPQGAADVTSTGTSTSTVDTSSVQDLSDAKAHKLVKHLHLLPLDHPSCPAALADDVTARFLLHRAHRIADAGILTHLPLLLDPFLDRRPLLKTWFVSNVLPLLRFGYEYYTEDEGHVSLEQLENGDGEQAVRLLLSRSLAMSRKEDGGSPQPPSSLLARDIKGLIGPWMYGATERKRRKLSGRRERRGSHYSADTRQYSNELEQDMAHEQKTTETQIQWDTALTWLTRAAAHHFPEVVVAMEEWDGPGDVDLGGYDRNNHMDEDVQRKLEYRYAQAAFAAVYAADSGSREAITNARGLLARIAELMDFEPPPELATSVDMLPKIDNRKEMLFELTSSVLQPEALMDPQHPLTHPATTTYALLQLFVFSAYLFLELGAPLSIVAAAKVRFQYDAEEQMGIVRKILHNLTTTSKRDEQSWAGVRSRLVWLWGWAPPREEDGDSLGRGIFGRLERGLLEKEILRALLNTGFYDLITKTYVTNLDPSIDLTIKDVEGVIVSTALHHYDNASNGNRNRGGVKKAADIIAAFRNHFPTSDAFRRTEALLAATHSLSFYSLTLQHGVPFQPVNIRVSSDPISLVEKVLTQNVRSYTKLDDLISIATNLVASGVGQEMEDGVPTRRSTPTQLATEKSKAERRVLGMAIEAALAEDDFETAYSYVINRLTSTAQGDGKPSKPDDISWRAALAAGRHKSSSLASSASQNIATPPALRRLEQRMELLSQTLLLAPSNALPEVLNVWRKCEEEMGTLLKQEADEEERFERRAQTGLPGAFAADVAGDGLQPRREVGRGGREEAPVGLFDVARGAAAAFSRSAFPLTAGGGGGSRGEIAQTGKAHVRSTSAMSGSGSEILGEERVRKRDMLSGAVTGGLASGIGWVLGAKPANT